MFLLLANQNPDTPLSTKDFQVLHSNSDFSHIGNLMSLAKTLYSYLPLTNLPKIMNFFPEHQFCNFT